jgi:hypothetical protein
MASFTLIEKPSRGDFFQPRKPKRGDPWLVIERLLVNASGAQCGSFSGRGTFMTKLRRGEAVVAVNGTNRITSPTIGLGQGDICTQGVFRFSDFKNPPVILAIVGGTGPYKDATGIVKLNSPQFTFEVT